MTWTWRHWQSYSKHNARYHSRFRSGTNNIPANPNSTPSWAMINDSPDHMNNGRRMSSGGECSIFSYSTNTSYSCVWNIELMPPRSRCEELSRADSVLGIVQCSSEYGARHNISRANAFSSDWGADQLRILIWCFEWGLHCLPIGWFILFFNVCLCLLCFVAITISDVCTKFIISTELQWNSSNRIL